MVARQRRLDGSRIDRPSSSATMTLTRVTGHPRFASRGTRPPAGVPWRRHRAASDWRSIVRDLALAWRRPSAARPARPCRCPRQMRSRTPAVRHAQHHWLGRAGAAARARGGLVRRLQHVSVVHDDARAWRARFSPAPCCRPIPASTSTWSPDLMLPIMPCDSSSGTAIARSKPRSRLTHARRRGRELAGHQLLTRVDVRGRDLALEARRIGDRAVLQVVLLDLRRLEERVLGHHVAGASLLDQALGHQHGRRRRLRRSRCPVPIQEDEQHRARRAVRSPARRPSWCRHASSSSLRVSRRVGRRFVGAASGRFASLLLARPVSGLWSRAHAQSAVTLVGGRSRRIVEVAEIS